MEPLRIGIAGAGAIAQRNAREAATSGAAKIVGVFDVNQKVARDMADALKAPFFPNYEDLLRSFDRVMSDTFAEIDSDGDGYVSTAEYAAAEKTRNTVSSNLPDR